MLVPSLICSVTSPTDTFARADETTRVRPDLKNPPPHTAKLVGPAGATARTAFTTTTPAGAMAAPVVDAASHPVRTRENASAVHANAAPLMVAIIEHILSFYRQRIAGQKQMPCRRLSARAAWNSRQG